MIIDVKDVNQCVKEMTLTIPADSAMDDYRETLKYFKNGVVVPGYRKGKAPLSMIDSMFSEQLKSSYLQDMIPKYFQQAIQEKEINPLYEPSIKDMEWDKGKDLTIVFQYEVEPKLEIKKYTGLEIPFINIEFEDKMIDEAIQRIRDEQSSAHKVEGGAEKGDFLRLDITFTDEDSSPDEDNPELNYTILSENSYGEQFNQALIGKKEEDEVDTVVKLEDGKEYPIKAKILEHRRIEKAEINEEFAKAQGFESLADFREHVAKDLRKHIDKKNREQKQQATFAKLMEENPFDVPPTLVLDYSRKLAEPYARYYDKTVEELAEQYYGVVYFDVKRLYLMRELNQLVPVEITDEDKENMVAQMAQEIELSVEEYKEKNPDVTNTDDFVTKIKEKKVIDYLYENNTFAARTKEELAKEKEDQDTENDKGSEQE